MGAGSTLRAPAPAQRQKAAAAAAAAANCSSCGVEVGKARFCPECGTPTAPPKLTCNGCGHQPEGTPKFCPECGGKMSVTS
jgi:membrane protease subunit (stomatin/prohibitin family)